MDSTLQQDEKTWNELDFIMSFEGGELSKEDIIDGFQHLIDNGHAWCLQGFYGRTAMSLINEGYCHR
jgi:hypothetical protein